VLQVFESSRPWYFDTSLVKVAVTEDDNVTRCLALRNLRYNATLAEDTPVGSHVAHVQLQLSCQSNVRSTRRCLYTQGEVVSGNPWSRYYRHFVGIIRYNVRAKLWFAIQIKLNQLV